MADAVREACLSGNVDALRDACREPGNTALWRRDEDGRHSLHWACSGGVAAGTGAASLGPDGGSAALLRVLLARPDAATHVDDADEARWTPLMIAASSGKVDAVRALLGAGASADRRTETGQTALHYHKASGGRCFHFAIF